MPGNTLDLTAKMSCPHGGTVSAVSSNQKVKIAGASVLRPSDTFTVSACTHTVTVGSAQKPSPCVTVTFTTSDNRVKAAGALTLSKNSSGTCYTAESVPQGAVSISSTQQKVTTR